ncbi:MAG: hypothetical protein GWN99_11670 [Gemmatimonadetes bacterium]|uniref:Uncharacterized protein n=1 Tax=Candidatus Kutchimonas denitrificans TaxID=3056748 RepID=A0AAE5CDA5_9BACT|nr:hypothetical protein [Gemmatimonadota bacterium]NIR75389.1 hypothetical protein [Candidatus Kutchimonas denitrificans]NIS01703.1 hypothetical protein [Gemmatimonadota bacterium]NIT67485.1 hypothetical protein [Gemmatimonadota bacterium]NIU53348.1 hypothetical protein [Gemmatimonadota bacterium]
MARHNREGEGTDQHGARYRISYQPDWLRQIKVSRTLAGSDRQSTKTLFRNPANCAEREPGDRVRTRVTSEDGKVDFEVTIADTGNKVDQVVVTSRSGDAKSDITFIIDGSLPKPGDLGKARRRRRGR